MCSEIFPKLLCVSRYEAQTANFLDFTVQQFSLIHDKD